MINLENLAESIVLITSASDRKANVIGTGFAFHREENYTYLLTCAHVVKDVGGEENVRVNNNNDISVDVVAIGSIHDFDLAVLRIKGLLNFPLFKLKVLSKEKEKNCQVNIPGNYLYSDYQIPECQTIRGIIDARGKVIKYQEKVVVWELKIEKGKLQGGYSGAPVVDLETGFVVGITTHMEGQNEQEGKIGRAICIEALKNIWPDIPSTISQQFKKESYTLTQLLLKGSDFNNVSPASFPDLDFSGISPETIQNAYQDSLPSDAEIWDLEVDNIEQILETLHQFRKIPQFFERLIQAPDIHQEFRDKLQDKLEKLAPKKSLTENTNKSSTDFFSHHSEKYESYILLAKLDPDTDEDFELKAWLVIDNNNDNSVPSEKLSKSQYLIDSNETRPGILCKSTQISTEFNKLLGKAQQYLIGKKYSLTIELFLPVNLMCEEVDQWKIYDPGADEEIPLGTRYPIRLRSLKRLEYQYIVNYGSEWCECWDKIEKYLPHKPAPDLFKHLEEMDDFNWKSLKIKLKKKIGLKVTRAHPESMRRDLFRAILSATTPIAIWLRNDIPSLNQVTFIDEILTIQSLNNLCKIVIISGCNTIRNCRFKICKISVVL